MKRQRQGGFLIARIHFLAGRIFDRMLREHGIRLNPAQGRILFPLWEHGPMTMRELARRSSLGLSTLSSMVDRLEASGHVVRERDAEDRRKVIVRLADLDKTTLDVYARVSAEMTALFYRGFTPAGIERFEADLARILDNLNRPGASS